MKQIKLEDDVHERLAKFCTRDKTFGECIDDLLANEPFVSRLKEVLPRTIAGLEANKKNARKQNSNVADDLVKICQWIIFESEHRSQKDIE